MAAAIAKVADLTIVGKFSNEFLFEFFKKIWIIEILRVI